MAKGTRLCDHLQVLEGLLEFERSRNMIQTVEAIVDAQGRIWLLGSVKVSGLRRALLTVLDEPAEAPGEPALLAQTALAADWNRPEEDAAWSYLQPEQ